MKKFIIGLLLLTASMAIGKKYYEDVLIDGNLTITGTVDGRDIDADGTTLDGLNTVLSGITTAEATQIEAIDSVTMTNTQWGYLGSSDQGISSSSNVSFGALTGTDIDLTGSAGVANRIVAPSETTGNLQSLARKKGAIYFDDTTGQYKGDDGSNLIDIGGGGGQGFKNFIENFNFETTADGINTYDDTGAFVDGTGGSPAAITAVRTETTPLAGIGSLLISKGAVDGTGEGMCITTETIDDFVVSGGIPLTFEFEWKGDDANYTDGDLALNVFDIGPASILSAFECIGGCNDDGSLPNQRTQIQYSVTPRTTTTDLRLCFHLLSDSQTGSAWTIRADEFRAGPDPIAPGAIITGWRPYTVIIGATTTPPTKGVIVHDIARWRRVGENMEIIYQYEQSAVGTAGTGNYTFSLPPGFSIDTNKIEGGGGGISTVGTATAFGSGALGVGTGSATISASGFPNVFFMLVGDDANAPSTVGASTAPLSDTIIQYSAALSLPIVGWASGALLNTNEANLQTTTATYGLTASTANALFADATTEIIDYDAKLGTVKGCQTCITTGTGWRYTNLQKATEKCTVSANINWTTNANLNSTLLEIFKNGSFHRRIHFGLIDFSLSGSPKTVELDTDEYFDIRATPDTGDSSTRAPNIISGVSTVDIVCHPKFKSFSVFGRNEFLAATSAEKTGTVTNLYMEMTGNSLILKKGTWMCNGSSIFGNNAVSPGYSFTKLTWAASNGGDVGSAPTAIDSALIDAGLGTNTFGVGAVSPATSTIFQAAETLRITTSEDTTIYLIPLATMSAPTNARVTVFPYCERIQ